MSNITRSYPNILKWLKAARVAALKDRGDKFMVGAREGHHGQAPPRLR